MEQENMKSLAKTFDILEIFLRGDEEISVTEISRKLNLNKTTVSRIMLKLVKRGYLKQVEKRGKYSLGTIFLEFSGLIKNRLKIRNMALPYLIELSHRLKESTMLAVWDKGECIVTESFHDTTTSTSMLKVVPDEGTNMPLYCSCLGKIFLAEMPEVDLAGYFNKVKLERRTSNTIVDRNIIIRQLKQIREQGTAYDNEEYALGVRGVAAGIYNNEGKIAGSIGIVVPSVRLRDEEKEKFIPMVKSVALEISKQLGYRVK